MKKLLCLLPWLAGCGSDMPTSPKGCATIAANFVRTDTIYYARVPATYPNTDGPLQIAYLMDIYACNGADVGQKRGP